MNPSLDMYFSFFEEFNVTLARLALYVSSSYLLEMSLYYLFQRNFIPKLIFEIFFKLQFFKQKGCKKSETVIFGVLIVVQYLCQVGMKNIMLQPFFYFTQGCALKYVPAMFADLLEVYDHMQLG